MALELCKTNQENASKSLVFTIRGRNLLLQSNKWKTEGLNFDCKIQEIFKI